LTGYLRIERLAAQTGRLEPIRRPGWTAREMDEISIRAVQAEWQEEIAIMMLKGQPFKFPTITEE
jgi:hypothetical protein